jgi:membrane fusion protein (multidrug efflux system)
MASRTTKRMFIMLGLVVLLVALLALFKFLQIRQMIASQPKPQPQVVSAVPAQMQEWQPQINAVGTLVAVRGVDLASEVAGLVRQVAFRSGQDVKADALLVQLNADAEVAQQRALQVAVDLAAQVLARDREQFVLRAKQASLAQQQALVAKKTIRAPFAGRLGISTINPGQYLNTGDKIVTLQKLDPMYIDFNVPQGQLGGIRIGQHVRVTGDAFAGRTFEGKVTAINPKVDPATRNVQVEATIANPALVLLPGMFARVEVDAGAKARYLTLPQAAITYNPYGSTVFVVEPGEKPKVRWCPTGVRHHRRHAWRPGGILKGCQRGPAGRHQRPAQAQERHAGGGRQQRAARQQPANPTPQEH